LVVEDTQQFLLTITVDPTNNANAPHNWDCSSATLKTGSFNPPAVSVDWGSQISFSLALLLDPSQGFTQSPDCGYPIDLSFRYAKDGVEMAQPKEIGSNGLEFTL
jgi:hypothetical protein